MTDAAPRPARLGDYLELTKPRLSLLSVLTALVGYAAARPAFDPVRLALLVAGTSMAAGGVASLNQWMESDTDARMRRTAQRPIPTGRVAGGSAFVLGWLLCIAALMLIFAGVGRLAALFTLLTIACYLGWYTPAKRWSLWSTEIGAVAGALPPLIGWSAAAGGVSLLGWILFSVLFFWQIPHFLAIAWTYRSDYRAVRFPMLPVRDEQGGRVAGWSFAATAALAAASVLPAPLGLASAWYGAAAGAAGALFLWRAAGFLRPASRDAAARRLFHFSLGYLPVVLGLLVADRLLLPRPPAVRDLPTVEAALNAVATALITAGFVFIRRGNRRAHRACMLCAAGASALFLAAYAAYHAIRRGAHTPFGGTGAVRGLYLAILWTHIPLAGLIAFLVPRTFLLALRGDFARHRAWARVTFPIWAYVSVTGVLVYLFLYRWWPARA